MWEKLQYIMKFIVVSFNVEIISNKPINSNSRKTQLTTFVSFSFDMQNFVPKIDNIDLFNVGIYPM